MRNESLLQLMAILELSGVPAHSLRVLCRKLCRKLGGCDIYMPCVISATEVCSAFIEVFEETLGDYGLYYLKEVLSRFGGSHCYIPKEISAFRSDVAFEILRAKEEEVSTISLAQTYRLSGRSINALYNYALKLRSERWQRELFK